MADATVSTTAMRIVKLLVGNPPQTVADLMATAGVTRTAVSGQLNELVAAGFVERGLERLPGRGRPRHLYSATDASLLLLFANSQKLIAPAIWKAIEDIGGNRLVRKVHRRVGRDLADHYNSKITSTEPRQRLEQLAKLLREEGVLVEAVEENGQLVVYKRSCAFINMLDEKHSVCCVDQEMMSAVVGRPVRRTSCRHEDDPCGRSCVSAACCAFAIVDDE